MTLPETNSDIILLRRAKRLRAKTGKAMLHSRGEIDHSKMTLKSLLSETLVRPLKIAVAEPIAIALNVYLSYSNALLYSWFDSFPLVYEDMYRFSIGIGGLPYLAILVGNTIASMGYCAWIYFYYNPHYVRSGCDLPPEQRWPPAILGAFGFPACPFFSAWSAGRIH